MNAATAAAARLAKVALTLLAVVILGFVLIRMDPGDPALLLAGDSRAADAADAAFVDEIRRDLGLDNSLGVQLASYLKSVLSLCFGISYRDKRPVAER